MKSTIIRQSFAVFGLLSLFFLSACPKEADKGPNFDPWTLMPTSELVHPRGWLTKRGIIHCHSPYSHDACDGNPFPDGQRNEPCFEDVRRGMCATYQDFVFLTDHDDLYAQYEYPDVLLYKDGDELIHRNSLPVANRVNCGDGRFVIVAAGTESDMMPIGLEHHIGDTVQEREAAYNDISETAIQALHDAGALVFLQHTEDWEVDQILNLSIDGIEIYNTHTNMIDNLAGVIDLVLKTVLEPEKEWIAVELGMLAVFQENLDDLYRWSMAVMQKPMVGVLATDVHQNTMDDEAPDGERVDSFRRMMRWFSNYVLVPDGPVDDAVLKEAIGHGRLYGVFDYLGYPTGFDFHAMVGDAVYEMGDFIPAGQTAELRVTMPAVWGLLPHGSQPELNARILKADNGDWVEVASGGTDLTYTADTGVYRAEVRMIPYHLRPWLGKEDPEQYLVEMIWIYSNPIYVGAP
jgi:hypothetical protein